ncbi:MAG: toll/interleukin-1 receptor domain-containing protein [Bryobacteraceae bacterium]
MTGPLADRLEHAILEFVMGFSDQSHQESWGGWQNQVERTVSDPFQAADIKSAFKRLSAEGVLRLSKPDLHRLHAFDYSGNESDDEEFFYIGPFNATITDQGRRYWDRLKLRRRNGVFISHITEEKPVAQVLQKFIKLAFGEGFRVFVSSDAKSIGGGKKWYTHIIDNLRSSEVVLVLVSRESKAREWINFEAGFGEGSENLVIPVAIKNMSLGQLSYPLAGLQGRNIDDIGSILDDIGNGIGVQPATVDAKVYLTELQEAEAALIYKSLKVEPVPEANWLRFDLENVGNVDLELLMLEVYIPRSLLPPNYSMGDVDVSTTSRDGKPYLSYRCYSNRGKCGRSTPVLRPIITPSMGKVRPPFEVAIRTGLAPFERELRMFYQIHAIGYRTQEEERQIRDLPSWT